MDQFIKWLQGYLIIQIQGGSLDQIFRMCKAHDISLWQIEKIDDKILAAVFKKNIFDILKIIRKSNAKAKIVEKRGFPFYLHKIVKRIYFYILIFFSLFALNYTQSYIWSFDVRGNATLTENEIMDYLVSQNITYGICKKNIDFDDIELKLREHFPVITWISVYDHGTKLHVDIKENDLMLEKSEDVREKIISPYEGEIVSILLKQGENKVHVGDIVHEGDILVEGKVPIYDEENNVRDFQMTNPEAQIRIMTDISYCDNLNNTYKVIDFYPEENTFIFIEMNGKRIYLNKFYKLKGIRENLSCKKQLFLFKGIKIPIYYGYEKNRKVDMRYFVYTDREMKEVLSDKLEKYILCLRRKGVQIIEKNVKISKNGSTMYLDAKIHIIDTIE